MTIADKIQRLQAAKAAIAAAITGKGGTVAAGDGFEDFAADVASIPSGITPTGNVDITGTAQVDVTNYATAQVVDADLVAGNIKQGVDILGVVGTYGGGGLPPFITKFDSGTFTPASDITSSFDIYHNLGEVPKFISIMNMDVPELYRYSSGFDFSQYPSCLAVCYIFVNLGQSTTAITRPLNYFMCVKNDQTGISKLDNSYGIMRGTVNATKFIAPANSTNVAYKEGYEYQWYVWA